MNKQAPRNGGRPKIKDAVMVQIKVPKDKVNELKQFAKTLRTYEKRKPVQ
jgi:hypothetical protein